MNRSAPANRMRGIATAGALAAALTAALTILLAGFFARDLALRETSPARLEAAHGFASDVASAVAATVDRAVNAGIPLVDLYGVDPYLQAILERTEEIAGIEIRDVSGAALFSVGRTSDTGGTATIMYRGLTPAGVVAVTPSFLSAGKVERKALGFVLALAIIGALASGVLARILILETFELPMRELLANARTLGRKTVSRPPRLPSDHPLAAASRRIDRDALAIRRLLADARALLEDIQTIDYRGKWLNSLKPVLRELALWRLVRQWPQPPGEGWTGWWALPVGLALAALVASVPALPLVGETNAIVTRTFALAVAVAVAAAVLGSLATTAARLAPGLAVAGLVAAALATGGLLLVASTAAFVALFAVATGSMVLAMAALTHHPGILKRRAFLPVPAVVATLALGPSVGSVLTHAADPRLAVLLVAVLSAVTAFILALRVSWQMSGIRVARPRLSAESLAALTAGAVCIALAFIAPAGVAATAEDAAGLNLDLFGGGLAVGLLVRVRPVVAALAALAAGLGCAAIGFAGLGLDEWPMPDLSAAGLGVLGGVLLRGAGPAAFSASGLAVAALAVVVVCVVVVVELALGVLPVAAALVVGVFLCLLAALILASTMVAGRLRIARPRAPARQAEQVG